MPPQWLLILSMTREAEQSSGIRAYELIPPSGYIACKPPRHFSKDPSLPLSAWLLPSSASYPPLLPLTSGPPLRNRPPYKEHRVVFYQAMRHRDVWRPRLTSLSSLSLKSACYSGHSKRGGGREGVEGGGWGGGSALSHFSPSFEFHTQIERPSSQNP